MEIFSLLPVSVIYLFNWLPKCADFACLCPPQRFSCFYHLNNYKVISKSVFYPHDTSRLHKQAFAKLTVVQCPKITFHGNIYCWCCHNFKFRGYQLRLLKICSSKHLFGWSVLGRKQQISAPCPTPHYFTSLFFSEHPKYLTLSLSILDLNYYK